MKKSQQTKTFKTYAEITNSENSKLSLNSQNSNTNNITNLKSKTIYYTTKQITRTIDEHDKIKPKKKYEKGIGK